VLKAPLETAAHHTSLCYEDAEGNFWVPGRKWRSKSLEKLPHISAPVQEDYILKVSPDGEILEEISILDVISTSA
jgi:hypothetical protein